MRNIRMIIGSIVLIAMVGVALLIWTNRKDEALEVITTYKEVLLETETVTVGHTDDIVVQFTDVEKLSNQMSHENQMVLQQQLERLFKDFLPEMASMKIEPENYYEQNRETIFRNTGLESIEAFLLLYQKFMHIPDYKGVQLLIDMDSLVREGSSASFLVTAVYDETLEVDFYVIMNLNTMEMIIR